MPKRTMCYPYAKGKPIVRILRKRLTDKSKSYVYHWNMIKINPSNYYNLKLEMLPSTDLDNPMTQATCFPMEKPRKARSASEELQKLNVGPTKQANRQIKYPGENSSRKR